MDRDREGLVAGLERTRLQWVRTGAIDPKLTLAVGSANPGQTRSPRGEPDELSDGELQRRLYCTGELKGPVQLTGWIVPASAIIFNQNGMKVVVVENGIAPLHTLNQRLLRY